MALAVVTHLAPVLSTVIRQGKGGLGSHNPSARGRRGSATFRRTPDTKQRPEQTFSSCGNTARNNLCTVFGESWIYALKSENMLFFPSFLPGQDWCPLPRAICMESVPEGSSSSSAPSVVLLSSADVQTSRQQSSDISTRPTGKSTGSRCCFSLLRGIMD